MESWRLLLSRWPLILLVLSTVLLLGAALRRHRPPLFEATALIPFEASAVRGVAPPVPVSEPVRGVRRIELARAAVAEEVAAIEPHSARVRAVSRGSDRFLAISARAATAVDAAALANSIAGRILERRRDAARDAAADRVRQLERERSRGESDLAALESQRDRYVSDFGEEGGNWHRQLRAKERLLRSIEAKLHLARIESREGPPPTAAFVSARAERAEWIRPRALGIPALLAAGLVAGLIAAFLRTRGQSRWDTIAELMQGLEVPVAGFAPLTRRPWVAGRVLPEDSVEAYRDLRNRILRLPRGDGPAGDCPGGDCPESGCLMLNLLPVHCRDRPSEALVKLACVLADAGRTTLVIDGDFRRASLHSYFDAARHPGLSDFLSGEMRLEETVIRSRRPNLWFMPAGPLRDDPGGLLGGRRMDDLAWELRSRFDLILIASPTLEEASDATLFAALADYTLLATDFAGHSLRRLRQAKTALATVSAATGGVVLTVRAASPPGTDAALTGAAAPPQLTSSR